MSSIRSVVIAAVMCSTLTVSPTARALDEVDFRGASTWGVTADGSSVYVCIENVLGELSAIFSTDLADGQTLATSSWGPSDGLRQEGFIGGETTFTIWHPYSATRVVFQFRLVEVECGSIGNLPAPGESEHTLGIGFTRFISGLRQIGYGFNCDDLVWYLSFDIFGDLDDPTAEPDGSAEFRTERDEDDDFCGSGDWGSFPDLEYYQQRAAEMEEASALPDTV